MKKGGLNSSAILEGGVCVRSIFEFIDFERRFQFITVCKSWKKEIESLRAVPLSSLCFFDFSDYVAKMPSHVASRICPLLCDLMLFIDAEEGKLFAETFESQLFNIGCCTGLEALQLNYYNQETCHMALKLWEKVLQINKHHLKILRVHDHHGTLDFHDAVMEHIFPKLHFFGMDEIFLNNTHFQVLQMLR